MKCTLCGAEYGGNGYTVTMNIGKEGAESWRLKEEFCSERCGLGFAERAQRIISENLMRRENDDRAA